LRQHQVHKEARVFFGQTVSVNSSLFGKNRTRRLLDPQKTQAAQMLEQRRLAASKRPGKENKAVSNHDSDLSGVPAVLTTRPEFQLSRIARKVLGVINASTVLVNTSIVLRT
jgi:hypothetical protein